MSLKIRTPRFRSFCLRKKYINELESSLTGDTIENSDSGMNNNPGL